MRGRGGRTLAVVVALAGAPGVGTAQAPGPPPIVAEFLAKLPAQPSPDVFLDAAKQALWRVYPQPDTVKRALVEYVARGADGRGVAFAALALIPFRDPATVGTLLTRARDPELRPATRWTLLNAAPYVLSVGDGMYMGSGELDSAATRFVAAFQSLADSAVRYGVGGAHARQLRAVFEAGRDKQPPDRDYGLVLWHVSAHLLGALDLRDLPTLEVFLDPAYGPAFGNVGFALSFAANRDFMAELRDRRAADMPPGLERRVADSARAWWRAYAAAHPDGDWRPAAREGFRAAGYRLGPDLRAPESSAELLRALDDRSEVRRYNAYRLLNDAYRTHFDLEAVFMAPKYAMSFLDPLRDRAADEARLKAYWRDRLGAR